MRRSLTVLALLAGVAAGCGDGQEDADIGRSEDRAAASQPATPAPEAATCREVAAPDPRPEPDLDRPTARLDPDRRWTAVMRTSCGTLEIRLAVDRAPKTASAFAALARRDFFEGLTFHRIVPDFVVQGGDPTGTGNGGPGFSVVEPPPQSTRYTRGTVAMAKTELEEPGTSGSQFFIVTAEQPPPLGPDYALVGRVTKGLDVLDRMQAVPVDPADGRPQQPVVIESVEIRSGR